MNEVNEVTVSFFAEFLKNSVNFKQKFNFKILFFLCVLRRLQALTGNAVRLSRLLCVLKVIHPYVLLWCYPPLRYEYIDIQPQSFNLSRFTAASRVSLKELGIVTFKM